MVSAENFKSEIEGRQVDLKTLRNGSNTIVSITNYGARIVEWIFKDVDVVVGFETLQDYISSSEYYYGATIGRYANRIAGGAFSIEGVDYQLDINNPPNHLHGGVNGFHNKVWTIENYTGNGLQLSYTSPDGEEGYPGNLNVVITYTLTDENDLVIEYRAEAEATTILNLTNHSYFNLNGQGSGSVMDHTLQINADHFTPVNENLIPLGQILNLDNSPFDFRISKKIGEDIEKEDGQLQFGKGYDHNYVLHVTPEVFAARAVGDQTGIVLEVYTNQPGMQFYTGNFMKGSETIKGGLKDEYRTAFCLETQHFPDAPNQPGFPSTLLQPGEVFSSKTIYKLLADTNA